MSHEKRITDLEAAVSAINSRLDDGEVAMRGLQEGLRKNTELTTEIRDDTSEVVAFFRDMKGAFRVLNFIGLIAKPVGTLVVVAGSIWAAIKSGVTIR